MFCENIVIFYHNEALVAVKNHYIQGFFVKIT